MCAYVYVCESNEEQEEESSTEGEKTERERWGESGKRFSCASFNFIICDKSREGIGMLLFPFSPLAGLSALFHLLSSWLAGWWYVLASHCFYAWSLSIVRQAQLTGFGYWTEPAQDEFGSDHVSLCHLPLYSADEASFAFYATEI